MNSRRWDKDTLKLIRRQWQRFLTECGLNVLNADIRSTTKILIVTKNAPNAAMAFE